MRLRLPPGGARRGAGDGAAVATVVEERIDGLLEHALLVADDDLGRLELEEVLEAVVPVDDPAMNGLDASKYDVRIGDLLTDDALCASIRKPYDVVAANIVAGVIIALAPFAKTCCKQGAPFIVSGIIDEREDEVKTALLKEGFSVEQILRSEGWVAMLLRA